MNAYFLVNYSDKIQKLFTEFSTKLDKRLKEEDCPLDTFIIADPTENKLYLRWIIDSYVNKGIKRCEDLLSRTKPALEDYIKLKELNVLEPQEKIIDNFCGIAGCSKKFKEKRGLEALIDKYKSHLEEHNQEKEEIEQIRQDTERVFENNEFTVLHPTTQEASCYYGKGTKWCTAATKGENKFTEYNKNRCFIYCYSKTSKL